MGKSAGTTKNTSMTGPLGFVMPSYEKSVSEANRLYDDPNNLQYYPGKTVAPFNYMEEAAHDYLQEISPMISDYMKWTVKPTLEKTMTGSDQFLDPLKQSITTAQGAISPTQMFGEGALDFALNLPQNVASNPVVRGAIDAAMQPSIRGLTEQVLPQLRTGFASSGGYGGTRQSLGEAQATERVMRGAQETGAGLMKDIFGQAQTGALNAAQIGNQFRLGEAERQMRGALGMTSELGDLFGEGQRGALSAAQLSPTLIQGMVAPGEIYGAAGGQKRQMEQMNIDEAIKKWNYEQALPFQKLQEFINQTKGPYGGVSQSQVEAKPSGSQMTAQTMGTILAAAGMAPELIEQFIKLGKEIWGWF